MCSSFKKLQSFWTKHKKKSSYFVRFYLFWILAHMFHRGHSKVRFVWIENFAEDYWWDLTLLCMPSLMKMQFLDYWILLQFSKFSWKDYLCIDFESHSATVKTISKQLLICSCVFLEIWLKYLKYDKCIILNLSR